MKNNAFRVAAVAVLVFAVGAAFAEDIIADEEAVAEKASSEHKWLSFHALDF